MKDTHAISLEVNGRRHELVVEARRTLADMLRHDLGYTGTHLGCEHGICGACTVLLDGAPVRRVRRPISRTMAMVRSGTMMAGAR